MISIQRLFGKEDRFFDLLTASAEEARNSIVDLTQVLRHEQEPSLEKFAELRKKDKAITQEINDLLVKTFVTALEREDIEALTTALYKIPKTVEKFAERYQISQDRVKQTDFTRQAVMLDEATSLVVQMIHALRKGMDIVKMKELNDRMQQIEGEADRLIVDSLRDLYSGKYDVLLVLIISNLNDLLEKVFDRCRDVGNVAKQIAYKNS
ncbi:hypothetical protein [Haloferula sp. BvORR071]|uniref:DUF47 domain-containing protein n=1 Tax=Haloferula sp. BvORR071 TaxID=1396141 RepID=UPI0005598A9D|nr:hypothetical protein [Haloferula sp. BvORR071]